MEKRHEAVLKALEKAQQEAAILKKAKLHRHVLEDAEEKERLEETLGVDSGKVEEALKQISQIEKQQKLEWESQKQRRSSLQKKKDVNDNHLPTTKSTVSLDFVPQGKRHFRCGPAPPPSGGTPSTRI